MRSFLRGVGFLGAVAVMTTYLVGCGCGVGPSAGPNNDNGVVTFPDTATGSQEQLQIPFQDSADTDETIMGATITGPDAAAFTVIAKYPVPLPAGTQVNLEIQFAPTHLGTSTATLVLQTENMGPSPVQLQGTAVPAGG
jgi:hypothetical protein